MMTNSKTASLVNINQLQLHLFSLALLLISVVFYSSNVFSAGQIMVTPTRIVFEGNDRTKQVNLINTGSETGRFRISIVNRKMTADGGFEEVPEGEIGMYADEIVRFSPRQVTLAPGQSQTVRIMLRKKRGMQDGEYRSHILFQTLPDPATSDINKLSDKNTKGLSVELIPIIGITIPVIVRQGDVSATVSLSDFKLEQANTVKADKTLSLKINRQGNGSSYGDFRVYFTPAGGEPVVVGQINGVAVYTPLSSRSVDIKLKTTTGVSLSKGELRITYLEPGKDETTGLLADSRLAVP
ncbi:MAG: fimbria/pilus periplasmic chaperone [Gammaproteobacteria bacterium]|nr:fimbria/pilus periplasmic chaperone [Gammaproteobacteria bacterium]